MGQAKPVDFVQLAREEGESIVQAFHDSTAQRGGHLDRILRDVSAMANTNGGTIYIGISADPKEKPVGVREPGKVIERLYTNIKNRFSPEPDVHIDSLSSQGKTIVRINVQPGAKIPYAIDNANFYVRDESETNLAVRDEIVRMVELGLARKDIEQTPAAAPVSTPLPEPVPVPKTGERPSEKEDRSTSYRR